MKDRTWEIRNQGSETRCVGYEMRKNKPDREGEMRGRSWEMKDAKIQGAR